MRRTLDWLTDVATVLAGLSAVVVAVAFLFRGGGSGETPRPDSDRAIDEWQVLAQAGHARGPENARLVIVEFGDYECPACRMFQPAIEAVLEEHGDDIRFVYRHWPLTYHAGARPAAVAAECAGQQGRFWEIHELLFRAERLNDDTFADLALKAGVRDLPSFDRCVADESVVREAIERDVAVAQSLKAIGTPALVINGVLLGSVPDVATLTKRVDDLLGQTAPEEG